MTPVAEPFIPDRRAARCRVGRDSGCRRRRRGFTLIEAGFVTVLLGLTIVGTLELLAAGTMSNAAGTEMNTAVQLTNNVREIALRMAFWDPQAPTTWVSRESAVAQYDNLLDLDGQTFSPPLDANRSSLSALSTWKQTVDVQPVSEFDFSVSVPKTSAARAVRVTVTIVHNNKTVYQTSWMAFPPDTN